MQYLIRFFNAFKERREYKFYSLLLFLAFLSFSACEEETGSIDINFGYEYYPLFLGKERVYRVDSIVYALEGTRIDTMRGFIRELITEEKMDADGETSFFIQRSYRKTMQDDWEVQNFFTARRTEFQAIRQEENLPLLKLIFPIRADNTWNPTAFFNTDQSVLIAGDPIEYYKGWEGSIVNLDDFYSNATDTYEKVLTVKQASLENLIELRNVEEKYAPGIGLVYRKLQILDTQCRKCCDGNTGQCLDIEWTEKAEQGLIIVEELIEL